MHAAKEIEWICFTYMESNSVFDATTRIGELSLPVNFTACSFGEALYAYEWGIPYQIDHAIALQQLRFSACARRT
jgi:hypothetical protein